MQRLQNNGKILKVLKGSRMIVHSPMLLAQEKKGSFLCPLALPLGKKKKYQPRPQAFMCYRVTEGGLEPSVIARGLAKNAKFLPDRGDFIPDFAEGKLPL